VGQRGRERAVEITAELRERLAERGAGVAVDEVTAEVIGGPGVAHERLADCDLVVSVGGDGTFLYAARGARTTPIVGVNLGEVGFLNAVAPDSAIEEVLGVADLLQDDALPIREVARLRASAPGWSLEPAINEVLVQGPRRGAGHDAEIEVTVDGSTYAAGPADGVLVATPTGSTAYNLSEGGPLVHPEADAMLVTPMFPREGTRPLVVTGDATIELALSGSEGGYAVSDGRQRRALDPPVTVTVERAGRPLRLAGPNVDFFEALGKLE